MTGPFKYLHISGEIAFSVLIVVLLATEAKCVGHVTAKFVFADRGATVCAALMLFIYWSARYAFSREKFKRLRCNILITTSGVLAVAHITILSPSCMVITSA